MSWDKISMIFSWVVALAAIVFPYLQSIADRKHDKQMKQMEIYERLNVEAIEAFVRAANESIMNRNMTEEFKRVNLSIALHAPTRFWEQFAEVAYCIEIRDFEKARTTLTNICLMLGIMDYFQSNEKVDSNFTKPRKNRKRDVKSETAEADSDTND